MPCCQGQDYDKMFDAKNARKELKRYERRGPVGETRRLLDALRPLVATMPGFSHLDIGGGVGVLQHELVDVGSSLTTAVDASLPYLNVLENAAKERGYVERQIRVAGDFTDVADDVEEATVVTLDKVICCYPYMPALVRSSARRATRIYGIVLPKDAGWVRVGSKVANWFFRTILRWKFQSFVHPLREVDRLVEGEGLTLRTEDTGLFWSVRVYVRG
jgi:magnesium-protoporphyrin O-methyltransferase